MYSSLTKGHFPETILTRYCNLGRLRKFWSISGLASGQYESKNEKNAEKNGEIPQKRPSKLCVKELVEHTL